MTVRTRIAPSPTGDPHVGTAYIALFNLCFARKHGGDLILRIEDTDRMRSTQEYELLILDSLRWLGIDWSEGPDVGGPHGPYRQSERIDIYRSHVDTLLERGHAFKCYRSGEELAALRSSRALKAEDLELPANEVARREREGAPYVVRMNVPSEGICLVHDILRGDIELDWAQVDAQILMKSDGMPTYHLANVVDDHIMKITHVMRGEEWINSAPKHQLLYKYFCWEMPVLCHLPLLRNTNKSKLSKRSISISISRIRRMGFLPQALANYLLGPDQAHFDIRRLSMGGPVFDIKQIAWLNGVYLRESLDDHAFIHEMRKWAFNEAYISKLLPSIRPRVQTLSEVMQLAWHFFAGVPKIERNDFEAIALPIDRQFALLQLLICKLGKLVRFWNFDTLLSIVIALASHFGIHIKMLLAPVFLAITGSTTSTSVLEAMAIIGSDLTLRRLRHAIDAMGGEDEYH